MSVFLKDVTEIDNILLILFCVIHYHSISIKPVSCLLHSVRNIENESLSDSSDYSQV
jgi:hypothetical protein